MSEKKKRKAVYDLEAQKKWLNKNEENREKRRRINRKSATKKFLKEDATLEELKEIKKLVEERENALNSI